MIVTFNEFIIEMANICMSYWYAVLIVLVFVTKLTKSELAVVLELLKSCSGSVMPPCEASSPSNGGAGLPPAGNSPSTFNVCVRDLSEKKINYLVSKQKSSIYLKCLYKLLLVLNAKPHSAHGYGRSLVCARICFRNTDGFVQFNWQYGHTYRPG